MQQQSLDNSRYHSRPFNIEYANTYTLHTYVFSFNSPLLKGDEME